MTEHPEVRRQPFEVIEIRQDPKDDGSEECECVVWSTAPAVENIRKEMTETQLRKGRTSKRGPRDIRLVKKQIVCHPKYKDLDKNMRWAFETGVLCGLSWCDKENNRWSRDIWAHLYRNRPLPP